VPTFDNINFSGQYGAAHGVFLDEAEKTMGGKGDDLRTVGHKIKKAAPPKKPMASNRCKSQWSELEGARA